VRFLLFLLLPVVLVGLGLFAPMLDARRTRSEQERAVALRMTLFAWLIGLLLLGALILLPNKQRVLMLVPVFVTAVFLGRLWRRVRLRARRDAEVDLERMKRVN
jgi:quinol-cytochrome oxidoreductase complex cytochrome b subunit